MFTILLWIILKTKMFKNISIIGLGYVGLPLLIAFSKKFNVIGIDVNKKRVDELKRNIDSTNEVSSKELKKNKNNIKFTYNYSELAHSNVIIVTLPTPIFKNKKPNLNIIKNSCKIIGKYLKKNDLLIFESTVYPGATNKIFVPIIEKYSKLKINTDFGCGYSPERVNPGDKKHSIDSISKIVSGSNLKSLNLIYKLYSKIINAKIYKAPSIEIAEAAKVIENCQRDINVAFMNEISIIFNKLGLNTNEIIKAASTKWNFLNFKPGLVGGHCIGVDPYYLTYVSENNGYNPEIILAGRRVNDNMGNEIIKRIEYALYNKKKNIKNSNILIMGFTFKENCNDVRNTKVFDIYKNIKSKGSFVNIYDPLIDPMSIKKNYKIKTIKRPKQAFYDIIIIAVSHEIFVKEGLNKIKQYGKKNALIFDVKNIFPNKDLLYL
jgi:UDP-N-acetyl-D-glucosamine/UDP-N-acetyl-D-galactosamine dehydrogenase